MTKLSEKEVLSRSRAACLSNVRKLISWGNDLTDISIVQKTVNLEILNVSVNKLTSLRDLSHCPKLKELYMRKNSIRNLEEVAYLKNLPQLNVLWINDNPMCDTPYYRETMIRTLPNLTKLDSVLISDEERRTAERFGKVLSTEEVLPNFEGLDLNHTLTTNAVALHVKNNLNSKSDEKLPISTTEEQSEVNGILHLEECESDEFEVSESSLPATCNGHEKDSNAVAAIKLLMSDMDHRDLQKIRDYAQCLLGSGQREGSRSVVLED